MASLGIITTVGFTCRRHGLLPHRDFLRPVRETGTKKPAAIWAISGGCGFCHWPGKYDTGQLVADFNLRLQIVLQAKFCNQVQLCFEPVNMPFFFSQDLDHHIPADIVMNAIGIGNGFT